jgi:hypothetical protein
VSKAGSNGRDTAALAVGAAGTLWRWRIELALIGVPLAAYATLADALGGPLALASVLTLVGAVAAAGPVRRAVVRTLRRARLRRRFRRAWIDADLPRMRLTRLRDVPAGEVARIRISSGSSVADVEARRERLAASIGLRDLRVLRDTRDASRGTVTFVRRDPLAGLIAPPWPSRHASALSLWDPIAVGVDELGGAVTMRLPERNVLLGGEPGAGKSVALSLLVATGALDPSCQLWLLDGKLVELSAWAPCAERLAGPDVDEAIELLRAVRAEMEERYRVLLAAGRRKIEPGDELALHLVACDELAFYLSVEDRKKQREFAELLRDLVARGRAAGVIVCAATQKPASDVVPSALRDLFGFRLALRCNTPQASDTILGQGWATLGHSAATIAPGERGIGLLLAEDGTPIRMRGYCLSDGDVDELASRATGLRADAWRAGAARNSAEAAS